MADGAFREFKHATHRSRDLLTPKESRALDHLLAFYEGKYDQERCAALTAWLEVHVVTLGVSAHSIWTESDALAMFIEGMLNYYNGYVTPDITSEEMTTLITGNPQILIEFAYRAHLNTTGIVLGDADTAEDTENYPLDGLTITSATHFENCTHIDATTVHMLTDVIDVSGQYYAAISDANLPATGVLHVKLMNFDGNPAEEIPLLTLAGDDVTIVIVQSAGTDVGFVVRYLVDDVLVDTLTISALQVKENLGQFVVIYSATSVGLWFYDDTDSAQADVDVAAGTLMGSPTLTIHQPVVARHITNAYADMVEITLYQGNPTSDFIYELLTQV
jgi:hypothetical protein